MREYLPAASRRASPEVTQRPTRWRMRKEKIKNRPRHDDRLL